MTNRERIVTVVAANAKYYGRDLDEITFAFYIEDLVHFPAEVVSAAFAEHRQSEEGRFMPRTGEIIAIIKRKAKPAIDPVEAWNQVMESFRTTRKTRFNPVVKRAIDAVGGLERIGMAKVGMELDKIRDRFVAELQVTENTQESSPVLAIPNKVVA